MNTLDQMQQKTKQDFSEERALYRELLGRIGSPQPGDAEMLAETMRVLGLVAKVEGRESKDPDLTRARQDAELLKTVRELEQLVSDAEAAVPSQEIIDQAFQDLNEYREKARAEIERLTQNFRSLTGPGENLVAQRALLADAQYRARSIGYAVVPRHVANQNPSAFIAGGGQTGQPFQTARRDAGPFCIDNLPPRR